MWTQLPTMSLSREKKQRKCNAFNNELNAHVNKISKGAWKRATCLTTLLYNKLNSDIARFTTHIKPVLQQIRLLTGLNVGGKLRNIAI